MKRISALLLFVALTAGSVWSQNKVLSLDGDGDYVEILDSDSLNLKSTATIEAWFKIEKIDSTRWNQILANDEYEIAVGGQKKIIIWQCWP